MADFGESFQQFADGFHGWWSGAGDVVAGGAGGIYNYVTGDDDAAVRRSAQYDHGQFVAGSGKASMYDGIGGMFGAMGEGISDGWNWLWSDPPSAGAGGAGGAGGAPSAGYGGAGPTDGGVPIGGTPFDEQY